MERAVCARSGRRHFPLCDKKPEDAQLAKKPKLSALTTTIGANILGFVAL